MKPFLLWLALTLGGFGLLGGGSHFMLSKSPQKVAVVLDSSFAMSDDWHRVPRLLDRLDEGRYRVFSLLTEKSQLHGYQSRLALGQMAPYGPRSFAKLSAGGLAEALEDADEVTLITNAPDDEIAAFGGWRIVRP